MNIEEIKKRLEAAPCLEFTMSAPTDVAELLEEVQRLRGLTTAAVDGKK